MCGKKHSMCLQHWLDPAASKIKLHVTLMHWRSTLPHCKPLLWSNRASKRTKVSWSIDNPHRRMSSFEMSLILYSHIHVSDVPIVRGISAYLSWMVKADFENIQGVNQTAAPSEFELTSDIQACTQCTTGNKGLCLLWLQYEFPSAWCTYLCYTMHNTLYSDN